MCVVIAAAIATSAFQPADRPGSVQNIAASPLRTQKGMPLLMVEPPSEKAIVIGAASVGAVAGVYFFGDLFYATALAIICAYGATTTGRFGGSQQRS